jgi:hypothetical protein
MSENTSEDKKSSNKLIFSSQEGGSKRWLRPTKTNPKNTTKNKIGRMTYYNKKAIELLENDLKDCGGNKFSALVDYIVSQYYGISYEEAYPDIVRKSFGEERRWDFKGVYRQKDIEEPDRNSRQKRKKKNPPLAWRSAQ